MFLLGIHFWSPVVLSGPQEALTFVFCELLTYIPSLVLMPHLPGILPNPILAWCPLRERSVPPEPAVHQALEAEHCVHFNSFDPTHNPVRKISFRNQSQPVRQLWESKGGVNFRV